MSELNNIFKLPNSKDYYTNTIGLYHEFYLSGEIKEPEQYTEWFHVIRNANQGDVIKVYINSDGGDVFTCIQFLRVLNETQATVFVSVEGLCASAATMIMLAADNYEISDHSIFMFHNYSGFAVGKGSEMYDQLHHEKKWSEKLLRSVYKDFLTEEEIISILNNKDIWMDSEEVALRLKKKQEKIASEEEIDIESKGI